MIIWSILDALGDMSTVGIIVLLCASCLHCTFYYFVTIFVSDHVISSGCFRWSIENCLFTLLQCIVVSETIGVICLALCLDDLCLLSHFAGFLMINAGCYCVTGSFHGWSCGQFSGQLCVGKYFWLVCLHCVRIIDVFTL